MSDQGRSFLWAFFLSDTSSIIIDYSLTDRCFSNSYDVTLEDSKHADVVDNVAVVVNESFDKMLLTAVSSATPVLQK